MTASAPARVVIGLLTGGQSTRMGRDKARVEVAGRTMAERVASACADAGFETFVLGRHDAGTGLACVPDDDDVPAGPLGGLLSLIRREPGAHVLLVATDQPFVRAETLRRLGELPPCDMAVPVDDDGWPQVTCARYGPAVLSYWEERVGTHDEVWRLRSLLEMSQVVKLPPEQWRAWGEDGRSFRSLDRPGDIAAALAEYPADI